MINSINMKIDILKDELAVTNTLGALIEKQSNDSIQNRGRFIIGLSGGSLIKLLCTCLPSIKTNWSKWVLLFCDERIVPFDNAESTFGLYKSSLLHKVDLKENQFIQINHNLNADECAKDYVLKMKTIFKDEELPLFDMLLLGMGPDGHTCSLFPQHSLLNENLKWVAPITDSPKPPPQRITLTFPVINNARCCLLPMIGEGKADMIKRILKDKEDLPIGRVRPTHGILHWLLDESAAKYIK